MHKFNRSLLPVYCLIFVFSLFSSEVIAQRQFGYATSNYSGTGGLYLNPASIADNRFMVYANLLGGGMTFHNDYISYDGGIPIYKAALDSSFNWGNAIKQNHNGLNHNADLELEGRGPGIMVSWNQKNSIAITTRLRTSIQAYEVAEPLILTLQNGYVSGQVNVYQGLPKDNFKINVQTFSELGFSYGRVLYSNKQNFLKAGITVKKLRGLFYFQYDNRLLDFNIPGHDSVVVYKADATVNYPHESYAGVTDFYQADKQITDPKAQVKSMLFGANKLGGGLGFDLGLQYEWRPKRKYYYTMDCKKLTNPSVNKYKLKVGASIVDLGGIKYSNKYARQIEIKAGKDYNTVGYDTVFWGRIDTMKDIRNSDSVLNRLNKVTGGGIVSTSNAFRMGLPTSLILSADYLVVNHVYMNATYVQSLRKRYGKGILNNTVLALTPRYERRWFEAAVPIVINTGWKTLEAGVAFKAGPFYIGSDNLLGLINAKPLNAIDFYGGFVIPIGKHMKHDRDKDKMSNKHDKCPDQPGTCETEGCPDRDGDGIIDSKDKCPDVPGDKKLAGCPDKDGDGVTDSLDECPDTPGLKQFKGCPDTDKDLIPDAQDSCPTLPGDKKLHGCPDKDKDGVTDDKDECPDVPGSAETHGCPDKDKDGVGDNIDKCPEKKGPIYTLGCPDRDNDSIPDYADRCPSVKGTRANKGCPDVQQEVEISFRNIEFESAKSEIQEFDYPTLDSLTNVLSAHPKYRAMLRGYTDSEGGFKSNEELSQDRSDAVKKYLVLHGINENRISGYGFGEANPLQKNDTAEGKQRNRRVEIELIQ